MLALFSTIKKHEAIRFSIAGLSMAILPIGSNVKIIAGQYFLGVELLATKIALKWEKPLSEVTGWVRARMVFAILRAINLCIRGSRRKWRSATYMDDGAGLPQLMNRICMCVMMLL